ncbi:PHD finger protein 20-like [Neolamprologus brichardi]|uniref:PHD finger protein 20-like n=1 Tax=Neolamprologus brichardi TaxID=32507 RepID=UPI0003EBF947|nr:PHD finger protein 20-like [Neolamprologus brichardi]
MKTPPDRSGITFEVGAKLEARDRHKNWYTATIEKIDYDKERVLIHYLQWSRRHDEWFQWNSPYLRPKERVSLRRQGLNPTRSQPTFVSGSKVLACWTDCRFYPAKILRVNKDDSYTVRFYDGVVRTVKPTKVKPFQEKSRSEKSAVGSEGWEEGESEEEEGGEGQEEEEEEEEEEKKEEEEADEKVTTEETDADLEREEDRKRKAEPSSSNPPAKKKTDDSRSSGTQNQPITADSTPPASAALNPAHIDRDVLLERQAHLPTTHKFSREPLYRVIKNQPPPILSIELDHNPFKCPAPGCTKSFRKASLLHYHIKYYHSDQQLEEQSSAEEAVRSVCVPRIRYGFCSSDDESSDRPPITLKLSTEHHNTHMQADDGSDWSTLTAESGEDTPSWPVGTETEECEVVRCVCEVDEENDFMIQLTGWKRTEPCDLCLYLSECVRLRRHESTAQAEAVFRDLLALCGFLCGACASPLILFSSVILIGPGWRCAQRFRSEPDLLKSGHMFGLSCVKENYSEVNASKISHTSHLLAHTYGISQVLSALQLKISLLRSPSHPDQQLWRSPWKQEERHRLTSSPRGEPPVCYVSSEHCYQKPGASWEKGEEQEKERPMVTVKQERSGEEKEIKPEDVNRSAAHTAQAHTRTCAAEPRAASVAECQLNLLEHIESLHQQISARMDVIERELDVLESWLDHSGELEPPDPLSRLPQLKQRIKRLLCDLCTVRRLSVCR